MAGGVALERQDRERAGRQEVLLGAAVVIALVPHGGDDARLGVVPAMRRDAGALADRRARAVRRHQQPGADGGAILQSDGDAVGHDRGIGDRGVQELNTIRPRLRQQRREQRTVLDHVRERLARLDLAVEGQERRPHRVVEAAVGDRHVEDRLRVGRDRLPDADGLEQPPRRRDDGRCARVATAALEGGIGNDDRKRRPERLPQGDRQRQAGEARTGDENVDLPVALAAHGRLAVRYLDQIAIAGPFG